MGVAPSVFVKQAFLYSANTGRLGGQKEWAWLLWFS